MKVFLLKSDKDTIGVVAETSQAAMQYYKEEKGKESCCVGIDCFSMLYPVLRPKEGGQAYASYSTHSMECKQVLEEIFSLSDVDPIIKDALRICDDLDREVFPNEYSMILYCVDREEMKDLLTAIVHR